MRKLLVAVCMMLLLSSAAWAQDEPDLSLWENLGALQAGQKIQVIDAAHTKHSGKFVAFDDAGVTLHEKKRDETITRANVLRVTAASGSRLHHTAAGLQLGTAIGAVVGGLIAFTPNPTGGGSGLSWKERGEALAFFTGLGFVVGTLVGVFLPTHDTIYKVTAPDKRSAAARRRFAAQPRTGR